MTMYIITHLVALALGMPVPKLTMWILEKVKAWLATKL